MARVFISHASEDLALAREVHRWLVDADHQVFLAQDLRDGITVGDQWKQRLHDELRLADAVVCVVTSAYLASMWCTAEVAIAESRGSRLLPVKAEPEVVHPLLTSVQHTDLTRDPDAARLFLLEALRQVGAAWPDDRCPFPGLRPFEFNQHRVFFGRTEETKELTELLRSPAAHSKGAALLVAGPSGCGKSSLARAGLVPVMAGEPGWQTLPPITPGADPVAALARELAAAAQQPGRGPMVTQIREQLTTGHLAELADELLLAPPGGPRRRLLVVVDQAEELLTQTAPADRARFAELLRPALNGPVQLVATLRPEFLDQLLADPGLATLPAQVYPLRPLRRDALRAVIEKPARLAGITVDDGLVDRLASDTDSGEALPLLAFTLAQLADGVTRGGRLSSARYDQLGGVQGALARQAGAALADAIATGGRSSEQVIAGLLRLVTVDEQGRPTRWRASRDELPSHVVTELDCFVTRRLLTTDTDNGTVVIGVAHEAFLSAWPPLAEAIAANVAALRARRAVEHAATEWHDHERPRDRLWGGGQLAAAVADTGACLRPGRTSPPGGRLRGRPRVLVTQQVDLSLTARDFLHTSIRHDRRRRRRAVTVLSVLLVAALVGAGVAVIQQRDARQQQRIATTRELIAQADAIRDTDPRTALLLGIAAERIRHSGETQASLVNTLTTTRYAGTLADQAAAVTSVAFSPDGRMLATGDSDGAVILRDLSGPARQSLAVHPSAVTAAAFSADGRTLATGSFDGTVILWDLTSPERRELPGPGHTAAVFSAAFSPDARLLVTGHSDGLAVVWDLADPARPQRSLAVSGGTVNSVALAPDGRTLATASDDGTARLWGLTDPTQPPILRSVLQNQPSRATAVRFETGTNYAAIIEGLRDGHIDIAALGPFSYVLAKQQGADITVVVARVDEKGKAPGYQSYGITWTGSSIKTLADFRGRKVCFVDRSSTSGYLYPRAELRALGIDPESDTIPIFAGRHDASVLAVANRQCDAGFTLDRMADRQLVEQGQLQPGQITTVWQSETIPGPPIVIANHLPPELRQRLTTALQDKANADYLRANGFCQGECALADGFAYGYQPADDADYNAVREICRIIQSESCAEG